MRWNAVIHHRLPRLSDTRAHGALRGRWRGDHGEITGGHAPAAKAGTGADTILRDAPKAVLGELEDNDEDLCDEDELDDGDVDDLAAAVAGVAVA